MLITAQTMRRVEVWSDYQCAGGTRLSVLAAVTSCVASGTISGEDSLKLVAAAADASSDAITDRRVIRISQDDTTFDEWRIVDHVRDAASGAVTVSCVPVDADLGSAAIITQVDGVGVARPNFDVVGLLASAVVDTFLLTALAAAGKTWVSRGTIDVDQPMTLAFAWDTPLAVIKRMAETLGLELQIRRIGTTGYAIDLLTKIGASAAVADLRYTKNLPGVALSRSMVGVATRVYPKGAEVDGYAATMANARWKVISVSGLLIGLADPNGGDGPILSDGQLDGLSLVKKDGTIASVSSTTASGQTIIVSSATGIANGDIVGFRAPGGTTDLTYLESPADVAALGVVVGVLDRPDVQGTENVIPNPAGRDWPSGTVPVGWTGVGAPTLSKNTAAPYVATAGASIRVQAATDGYGVISPAGSVRPTATSPYGSGRAIVWIVSGKVRVELVITKADTTTVVLPVSPNVAYSTQLGQFVELGVSGEDWNALTAVSVAVRIVAHGGAAEFYVDAAQATLTPAQDPFVEGSGGTKLWQAANEQLRLQAGAIVSLEASIVDLARIDPSSWGDDAALVQGGTVRITDQRLATVDPPNLLSDAVAAMGADANADGIADGWTSLISGMSSVSFAFDATEKAQRINATSLSTATYQRAQVSAIIAGVNPGDLVTAQVNARCTVGSGSIQGKLIGAMVSGVGALLGEAGSVPIPNGASYADYPMTPFVAPAGTTQFRIECRIESNNPGSGSAWFRNVKVQITNRAGIITTRLVQFDRDYVTPGASKITLSSNPADLGGTLARPKRPARATIGVLRGDDFSGAGDDRLGKGKYRAEPTIDAVESGRTIYTFTVLCTARDPDFQQVRIAYRSVPANAPSDSYTSPAPTFASGGAYSAQPLALSVTVDRDWNGLVAVDRLFEVWAEDTDGNRSAIQRVFIPAIVASDAEAALPSVGFTTAFTGACPGSFLRDTVSYTRGAGVPPAWTATTERTFDGGSTWSAVSGGGTSPVVSDLQTNVKAASPTTSTTRQYRVRVFNAYGSLVDEDLTTSQTTNFSSCP